MNEKNNSQSMIIGPNLDDKSLVSSVTGKDHLGLINKLDVSKKDLFQFILILKK